MFKFIACLAVLALAISDVTAGTDWPGWRGANFNGTVETEGVLFNEGYGLKTAWKKSLGSAYSSISISGNQAITMFSDNSSDFVVSLNINTGKELWRYKIDTTFPKVGGGHIGPNSTPLIDDNKVFGVGPNGQLFALEADTGKPIWSNHLVEDFQAELPNFGFTTSPLVVGNILIVEIGGEKSAISGFDKNTGKVLWSAGTGKVEYQSPTLVKIAGTSQVICSGTNSVMGLNPKTGAQYWSLKHDGGAGSYEPLFVGPDKLFLKYSGRESMMLQVKKDGDTFTTKELWKTRDMANTLSIPVHHKGYLYGYSRRFLTCLEAETGKLVWKSREPGEGLMVLLDDYLVIQTRDGEMHVGKASPEGYKDVASLEVFPSESWTPPSFANGRIYARSLADIAAIDIAKVDWLPVENEPPGPVFRQPDSKFAAFVREVDAASDKQARIDAFLGKQKEFPIIENNKYAHIVYQGKVKELILMGDMVDTGEFGYMSRIEGTDFYYASLALKPDARINYSLTKDYDMVIGDPLNKREKVRTINGEFATLAMPKWERPSHLKEPSGARGELISVDFESKILGNTKKLTIYLPPGYKQGKEQFPTVYVNNGQAMLDLALMGNTLDNLIGKKIKPVIGVFIESQQAFQEYARDRRDDYSRMLAEEIVPFIDSKYRTSTNASDRALMGGDEGAYAAYYAAFSYPKVFSKAAGHSTHLFPEAGGKELMALVEKSSGLSLDLYLDWGSYDSRHPTQVGGYNYSEFNRDFVKKLKQKGYSVSGGEHSEGWGFASWRNHTDDVLGTFFSIK